MRDIHPSEKLSPSYYEALGRVLVAFQALEEAVTYSVAQLTRTDKLEEVDLHYVFALSELPFRSRVKLLRNFLETTKPSHYLWKGCPAEEKRRKALTEMISQLCEFVKGCNSLEDERNQITHSTWEPSESGVEAIATRFKLRVQDKKTLVVREDIPQQRVMELVERMQQSRIAIENISLLLVGFLAEKRKNAL